jgi:exodeoxyribonuclease VII small subunit
MPPSRSSAANAADPALAALSFEDALAELERIVKGLEGGQQKLEEAIVAYERGTRLRQHCEAKLQQAETRVQAIVTAADGSVGLRAEALSEPEPAVPAGRGRKPAETDDEIPF